MPKTIHRRGFLGSTAATAAFLAMHDLPVAAQAPTSSAPHAPAADSGGRPRLLALELRSGAPLAEMKAFYGKTLELGVRDAAADRFTVEAGETRITFVHDAQTVDGRAPFYHFAFNIPENKIAQALEWQQARTPLLPIPERNRAAGYPPEVVDKGASDQFTAMGDEYGLLLLMKRGRVLDFTGNEANGARVYPTNVTVRGARASQHQLGAYPYRVALEERCSCA